MVDLEKALFNPTGVFHRPSDVLKDKTLSREQKIDILRRWAYDEREMAVAEEENMTGVHADSKDILDEILKSLLALGIEGDEVQPPPTKHG